MTLRPRSITTTTHGNDNEKNGRFPLHYSFTNSTIHNFYGRLQHATKTAVSPKTKSQAKRPFSTKTSQHGYGEHGYDGRFPKTQLLNKRPFTIHRLQFKRPFSASRKKLCNMDNGEHRILDFILILPFDFQKAAWLDADHITSRRPRQS